jgi:hypothetical protein
MYMMFYKSEPTIVDNMFWMYLVISIMLKYINDVYEK